MLIYINDYILEEIPGIDLFVLVGKNIKSIEEILDSMYDTKLITLDNGDCYILRAMIEYDEDDNLLPQKFCIRKILRKKTKQDYLEEEIEKTKRLLKMHKEQISFHKMSLEREKKELKRLTKNKKQNERRRNAKTTK